MQPAIRSSEWGSLSLTLISVSCFLPHYFRRYALQWMWMAFLEVRGSWPFRGCLGYFSCGCDKTPWQIQLSWLTVPEDSHRGREVKEAGTQSSSSGHIHNPKVEKGWRQVSVQLTSPFSTLKGPIWEVVLPMNKTDLPTAVNVIKTILYSHAQRPISPMILGHVELTIHRSHHCGFPSMFLVDPNPFP